jgi:hypothetical protein
VKRGEVLGLLLLILIMAGMSAGDRYIPKRASTAEAESEGRVVSTVWYCPVPTGEDVSSTISTANLAATQVRLRRWGAGEGAASPTTEIDLPARRRQSTAAADLGRPSPVGIVEAFGAATVADFISLGSGVGSSRCSDQPEDRWLFPVASTARSRDTFLLVANPFAEEARITVRFMTPGEDVTPSRLREVNIPRLTQVSLFLGDYRSETEAFAVEVGATRGRVIVSRLMRVSGGGGFGLSANVGVQELSRSWLFAGGEVPTEGEEEIVLANPGEHEALIQISFQTDTEQITQPALREVAVPAGRSLTIKVSEHLPRGTRHGTSITSLNEVGVVAERFVIGLIGGVRGAESSFGATGTSSRWAVSVASPAGGNSFLDFVNWGAERAVASVTLLTDQAETKPPELSALPLEPGRRATVDITSFVGAGAATAVIESASDELLVDGMVVLGPPYRDFAVLAGMPL